MSTARRHYHIQVKVHLASPLPLLSTPNALSVPRDPSPTVWALNFQKMSAGPGDRIWRLSFPRFLDYKWLVWTGRERQGRGSPEKGLCVCPWPSPPRPNLRSVTHRQERNLCPMSGRDAKEGAEPQGCIPWSPLEPLPTEKNSQTLKSPRQPPPSLAPRHHGTQSGRG